MGRLIKDENKSVNFLKASCTLDASVKIYSHRVDDTYSTSHRILESLSRNNGAGRNVDDADAAGGDDDDGDDDGSHDGDAGGNRKKTKGRLGSKAAHRAHLSQTIERNAALLNAVKLENDYFVDPMFHKISKAFDEGGAKGMLMNNLRLKPGTCQLRFHFEANENAPIVDESVSASFCGDAPADSTSCPALCADEVAALLGRAAIDAAELQSLEVCPPLNIYRENLGILNENADSLREILSAIDSIDGDAQPYNDQFPTFETKSDYGPAADDDACAAGHFEYDGCGDANDDDYCDDGDCFGIVSPIAPSAGESVADVVPTKLRWGRPSDSDKDVVSEAALAADVQMLTAGLENLNVAGREEEYSFFDTNSLFASNSNAWAGAKHWKFATKRRAVTPATASAAAATSIDAADEDNAALAGCDQLQSTRGKQQAKGKKKQAPAQYIDFSKVDQLDEDVFDIPSESQGRGKSVSDATLLSESVQAKAESFAASLFLPPDAKLEVKDLCRLFLSPTVMIPSSAQQRIALTKSASLAQTESIDGAAAEGRQRLARLLGGGEMAMEKVWGVQPTYLYPTKALLAAGHLTAVGSNGNNERSNDECYDDQFGDDAYDAGEASFDMDYDGAVCDHPAAETHGLAINQDQLLQASRTVGKIEIRFVRMRFSELILFCYADLIACIYNYYLQLCESVKTRKYPAIEDRYLGQYHRQS